jgi:hypothetical protein
VTVSGRVLDFATNARVVGSTVEFRTDPVPSATVATAVSGSDGSYAVVLSATRAGVFPWSVFVDGVGVASMSLTETGYRGDLLVRPGTCVARYGIVSDLVTLRPVADATVMLAGVRTRTTVDGWYRIDLGCPATGLVGLNTTGMYVSHPEYADTTQVVGRGVFSVYRMDVRLARRSPTY